VIDTLIVGFGIAGLNYAEKLRQNKKEFRVIAPVNQSASKLSAGIINPTVLKRFNSVWKSDEFLNRGKGQFDRLYEEAEHNARIMVISVHPYITGVPHRIKYLEALLDYVMEHDEAVFMTASEIGDWYTGEMAKLKD